MGIASRGGAAGNTSSEMAGRVVVITGATGGLGRVAAQAFASRGASLALVSSDQAKLDALAGELALPASRFLTHAADLREPTAARVAARSVVDRFGHAEVVLHLVGGWVGGKELTATDPADLNAMLDQHVWTTFGVVQAFVPLLEASGKGRFVVVSSPVATHPQPKVGAYAAAKAAEEALILTLAQEAGKRNVTANIVQVSAIDVAHQRETAPTQANAAWTTPEEITAALLYLCSDAGGAANGIRLTLAGRKS